MKRVLLLQVAILTFCVWAVTELVANFPFPSPLIKPFLPPTIRWPSDQIKDWVNAGDFSPDFLEYFARDPERVVPPGPVWVAPADGVIGPQLFRDGNSYLIVKMSFWDVHVIRAPLAGVVTALDEEGIRVERDQPTPEQSVEDIYERGKDAPVQKIVTIKTEFGEVKVRMISSYWASRLRVWVHVGQKLSKGERIGRILIGSTTVFEVPGKIDFLIKPGVHVSGGQSVIYDPGGAQ
jgi:phosphatidylserine decarboxylase